MILAELTVAAVLLLILYVLTLTAPLPEGTEE